MERIVRTTPALYASYLEKLSRMQAGVADIVRRRLADQPRTDDNGPSASTILGAAIACFTAAQDTWKVIHEPHLA